jgi:glycosyltransferase involved in cell wall biosynthesis
VSANVRSKRPPGQVFEAPQSVDPAFWGAPATPARRGDFQVLFAGRLAPEKGVDVLLQAHQEGTLVLAGDGPLKAAAQAAGAVVLGPQAATDLRNSYAGSDVVVVPSVPTRDFLEPWGLVVNEAFHQGVPVIATDAVGAAAGGLVQHERTGLVVPAGDAQALTDAISRLKDDPALRRRLGENARAAVAGYTPQAWARGMSGALQAAGAGRGGC